ncbi:MAG: hypothetical protein HC927_00320 [Deltaproteobacteria bacterium]|nr:hypothetical protein [Deltaproteobacteria bacterium]
MHERNFVWTNMGGGFEALRLDLQGEPDEQPNLVVTDLEGDEVPEVGEIALITLYPDDNGAGGLGGVVVVWSEELRARLAQLTTFDEASDWILRVPDFPVILSKLRDRASYLSRNPKRARRGELTATNKLIASVETYARKWGYPTSNQDESDDEDDEGWDE